MPSPYIDDNFNTYLPNTFPGGGPWTGGNAFVRTGGDGHFSAPFAPYPEFTQICQCNQLFNYAPFTATSFSFIFSLLLNNGSTGSLVTTARSIDFANQEGPAIATLEFQSNNTLAVTSGNGVLVCDTGSNNNIGNSGYWSYSTGEWILVQQNIDIIYNGIGQQLTIVADIAVNGILRGTGSKFSAFTPEQTFTGDGSINSFFMETGGLHGGWLGNVTIYEPKVPIVTFPIIRPVINSRISQMVLESMELPSNSNSRVSQMAIELSERPSTSNARISQMVIELMTQATPGGISGWIVKES